MKSLLEAGLIVLVSAEDLVEAAIAELKAIGHTEVHEFDLAASAEDGDEQTGRILSLAQSLQISVPRP